MSNSFFYGVYLLCSQSVEKRYNGRCYIGFTVNPKRRINQHNRGKDFGGAKRTSNKGPWQMVMIVHGFPNNISALQVNINAKIVYVSHIIIIKKYIYRFYIH